MRFVICFVAKHYQLLATLEKEKERKQILIKEFNYRRTIDISFSSLYKFADLLAKSV